MTADRVLGAHVYDAATNGPMLWQHLYWFFGHSEVYIVALPFFGIISGHVCVVCPWHGSTFQLDDGAVVHGPASTDQQVLPTRVVDGVLQARRP